ncbi:MAG: CBS domain-containing protein [Gammaproteobacteria bacterium]|jgi:predicted transcriptional regulator|nr:CBS domain-containing protein [Gammaproteobacteria bacterium]
MNLEQILIPTKVASPGMTVRKVFTECGRANIPALPFGTKSGRIRGRITLKNILKVSCLPEYMIESARILGEEMFCMEDIEAKAKQLLNVPVDAYVQEPALSLGSEAPVIKALAMMEQNDTSYLFVVDNGQYRGAVTIQCLAKLLTQLG